jgi:hypothetical protein
VTRRIPTATQGYIASIDRPRSTVPLSGGDARFGQSMGEQRWGRAGFDRDIAGLPGGEDEGTLASGPNGYARSDERIREDVCERLASNDYWLDLSEVEVCVQDGEVRLRGTTASREQKHAIEDIAAEVSGVLDVVNELRVR